MGGMSGGERVHFVKSSSVVAPLVD
jgi:hypothetical protein